MNQVNDALRTVGYWLQLGLGLLLRLFAAVEASTRSLLAQAGVPASSQTIALLVVDVLLAVVVVRLFGGIIRVVLILFLVLLVLHILGMRA